MIHWYFIVAAYVAGIVFCYCRTESNKEHYYNVIKAFCAGALLGLIWPFLAIFAVCIALIDE